MSSGKPRVSIIVVVKDDRGIAATLDHVHMEYGTYTCETIVIDASEPARLMDIRAARPWVRWEQFPVSSKRTTPAQRNRGLALATGEVIVFIDANCIPETGWLTALMTSIDAGEDIVCGPVHDLNKSNLVHYAPELLEPKYIDVCTTINVALRRRVVTTIGIFDTTFSFGQDVDFFWRARSAGFKIFYNPQAAIGHDWGEQKEQLRRAFDYGKARAHLYKKHWTSRHRDLLRETHVWIYPLFIIGLPLTFVFYPYPLLILIPVIKNYSKHPFGLVAHHLAYGIGVLAGTLMVWPKPTDTNPQNMHHETQPEAVSETLA